VSHSNKVLLRYFLPYDGIYTEENISFCKHNCSLAPSNSDPELKPFLSQSGNIEGAFCFPAFAAG